MIIVHLRVIENIVKLDQIKAALGDGLLIRTALSDKVLLDDSLGPQFSAVDFPVNYGRDELEYRYEG